MVCECLGCPAAAMGQISLEEIKSPPRRLGEKKAWKRESAKVKKKAKKRAEFLPSASPTQDGEPLFFPKGHMPCLEKRIVGR
jgi:hypothetical protein